MSYEVTSELGLRMPVKGSGEQFDSDVYAEDLAAIDAGVVADRARITALEGVGAPQLGVVNDLAALTAATPARGSQYSVRSTGVTGLQHDILFLRGQSAWVLISPIVRLATKANLDSFVTAASALFVRGQRLWSDADGGYEYLWNGTAIEPSRIRQGTSAPANPVAGQLFIDTDA